MSHPAAPLRQKGLFMETPMSSELQAIKNLKQIAREEFIAPGTAVCGGCGGLEALRLAAKVLGPKTVFVNAAGCFTLLATFPYTPFKGSWLYTTMGSAAAGAQGVRDALDVLMARGKMAAVDDVEVVVVAGDGSTYDIGLSSTSGALFRDLNFWYFCYDNEAYGNTGMQMSSATPYGARTMTSPRSTTSRAGTEHGKKDLFAIWQAHRPARWPRSHRAIRWISPINSSKLRRCEAPNYLSRMRRAPPAGSTILLKRRNMPIWRWKPWCLP